MPSRAPCPSGATGRAWSNLLRSVRPITPGSYQSNLSDLPSPDCPERLAHPRSTLDSPVPRDNSVLALPLPRDKPSSTIRTQSEATYRLNPTPLGAADHAQLIRSDNPKHGHSPTTSQRTTTSTPRCATSHDEKLLPAPCDKPRSSAPAPSRALATCPAHPNLRDNPCSSPDRPSRFDNSSPTFPCDWPALPLAAPGDKPCESLDEPCTIPAVATGRAKPTRRDLPTLLLRARPMRRSLPSARARRMPSETNRGARDLSVELSLRLGTSSF